MVCVATERWSPSPTVGSSSVDLGGAGAQRSNDDSGSQGQAWHTAGCAGHCRQLVSTRFSPHSQKPCGTLRPALLMSGSLWGRRGHWPSPCRLLECPRQLGSSLPAWLSIPALGRSQILWVLSECNLAENPHLDRRPPLTFLPAAQAGYS